jgi:hypothetical protein
MPRTRKSKVISPYLDWDIDLSFFLYSMLEFYFFWFQILLQSYCCAYLLGLLGKANQRFTMLGLDLKTLISDTEAAKDEKDSFTIDDLRDNPNLQFR